MKKYTSHLNMQKELKEAVAKLLETMSAEYVLSEIYDQTKAIENKAYIEDLNQEAIFNLNCEGYVVVKADTQKEQMELTELLQTVIVNHNDQQTKLFYN
jgi:hypothetical protein